jgi:hypothetical protein
MISIAASGYRLKAHQHEQAPPADSIAAMHHRQCCFATLAILNRYNSKHSLSQGGQKNKGV